MVRSVDLLDEATLQAEELQAQQELKYGVDVSFPMHHQFGINGDSTTAVSSVPTSPPLQQFTRDRRNFYQKFLAGCINSFGSENCLRSEQERIDMSLRQPATMKNLTKGLGFRKLKVPETLFEPLKEFWDRNQHEQISEFWPAGSTIVNHWGSLPSVVKVENDTLIGGGDQLTDFVWGTMRGIVAEWTGHELKQASMYGIRVYKTGAVLTTHVDRQPLVSSAIINVAQDVDEPWPLEVIGTDGMAYNVTMEPGDLVLYESHSLLHGVSFEGWYFMYHYSFSMIISDNSLVQYFVLP